MDDFEGTYAPQSPDLSGFQTFDNPDPFSNSYYPPQQAYLHQPTNHDTFSSTQPSAQISNTYQPPIMAPNGKSKAHAPDPDDDFAPDLSTAQSKGGSGRKSKKPKVEEDFCSMAAPGVEEGIEVKTKFPVARIKRIMQADEDVGKVAQVTPTAVSKALELFMISVVTKAANQARAKSSKRVTAAHLKQAVEQDEQLDFLADIISKIPDAPAPKKEKEEDSEDAVEVKKKKKIVTKRKKKDDDDF